MGEVVQDLLAEYDEKKEFVRGMELVVPKNYLEEMGKVEVRVPDVDRDDDITKEEARERIKTSSLDGTKKENFTKWRVAAEQE